MNFSAILNRTLQILGTIIILGCAFFIVINIYYQQWTYSLLGEILMLTGCSLDLKKQRSGGTFIMIIGLLLLNLK